MRTSLLLFQQLYFSRETERDQATITATSSRFAIEGRWRCSEDSYLKGEFDCGSRFCTQLWREMYLHALARTVIKDVAIRNGPLAGSRSSKHIAWAQSWMWSLSHFPSLPCLYSTGINMPSCSSTISAKPERCSSSL